MHEHVADPAEAAVPRFERGKGEARGDRGIDRVTSGGERLGPDFGGEAVLRGDDAAPRVRRGLPHLPVLRPVLEAGIHW